MSKPRISASHPRPRRPLALAVSLALAASGAHAATIAVTSALDDGTDCTLREAIQAMKDATDENGCVHSGAGFGDTDTITFDGLLSAATITLTQGQLAVDNLANPLTITGSGQTIDANQLSRVLYVDSSTLTVSSLTLTNGAATAGAGIDAYQATLTLDHVTVNNNTGSAYAGGIRASTYTTGALTLNQSSVSNNVLNAYDQSFNAAGIYVGGETLVLDQSTVSNNTLNVSYSNVGLARWGSGGIYLYDAGGTSSIIDSTISGNSVIAGNEVGFAGGIYSQNSSLEITNSTLSGNMASCGNRCVGGLEIRGATAVLANSTLSGNSAAETASTHRHYAGGAMVGYDGRLDPATVTLTNSIVSGNSVDGTSSDLYVASSNGTATASFSLLGGALSGTSLGSGNRYYDDPGLSPLANNGGPTLTMALLPGSPAIDTGSNALVPTGVNYDQRGPGYPRISNSTVDIGAFELRPNLIFADGFESGP
jgi:hypothetical protein